MADHTGQLNRIVALLDHATAENKVHNKDMKNRYDADAQSKKIARCDGTDESAVRDWIDEVKLTARYSNRTVYIAAQSSTGSLKKEIERFLDTQPDANLVSWATLQTHLESAFLSPVEDERLRQEVTTIKQQQDNLQSYNRKFSELALKAYPLVAGQRNADQVRILLQNYIRGLSDKPIKAWLVLNVHPKTFEEAIVRASSYHAEVQKLSHACPDALTGLLGREEEPMDISALSTTVPQSCKSSHDNLERQMLGMSKQFTKVVAILERIAPAMAAAAAAEPAQDNAPIMCNYCHKVGHVVQQCRKKKAADRRRESNTQDQGGQ